MKITWFLIVALALSVGAAYAQNVYDGCNQPWGVDLSKDENFIEQRQVGDGVNAWTPPKEVKLYKRKDHSMGPFDEAEIYYQSVEGKFCAIHATINGGTTQQYKNIVRYLKTTCGTTSENNLHWRWASRGSTAWVGNGVNVLAWIENDALAAKMRAYLK